MESEVQTKLLARLAERGLALKSFDHQVLTLRYDPEKDSAAHRVVIAYSHAFKTLQSKSLPRTERQRYALTELFRTSTEIKREMT